MEIKTHGASALHAELARSVGPVEPGTVLEATPEPLVVTAADGRILFANRGAERLTGFTRVELIGKPIELLVAAEIEDRTPGASFESRCRTADGDSVPVEVRLGTIQGSEVSVMTLMDATELVAGREARVEAEAKFRALVEQISAITYTWTWVDGDYVVRYVSPQIESMLGYTPEEWAADPAAWYAWVHPEDRASVVAENKRCETSGESYSMEYRMACKGGRTIWVEDSWVVVDNDRDGNREFQGVVFDITDRKAAAEQIAFLAYHDKLTGLPNRALFEEILENAIARARRHDLGVGVLFLDLDNFKLVNDSLGHQAGDALLVQLAERLRGCTRETDLVARQGGDEFLLLLSDLERGTSAPAGSDAAVLVAQSVAERVQQALRDPFLLDGVEFYASGSIGISLFPQDALDSESLLRNADSAMYRSKKVEPGGYTVYASATGDDPMERLSLSSRLRRAVEQQHWVLHYQPVLDLSDGRMVGVEALVRWADPSGGLVAPGEFIPLAEELGLIEAIGDWVIDEMSTQQAAWTAEGLDLEMSFNLSPRQMWSAALAEKVLGKITSAGVDPGKIVVEITESTAMADPDRTQKILSELHAWGFTLAIDDFGTGYSSLARLKHMPVDILKIDQVFVRNVDRDLGLAGMVRAMIQLAQSLNMVPLAEGIETQGELIFLRANGCRLAQGFLFARPVPADEIPALARRKEGLFPPYLLVQ